MDLTINININGARVETSTGSLAGAPSADMTGSAPGAPPSSFSVTTTPAFSVDEAPPSPDSDLSPSDPLTGVVSDADDSIPGPPDLELEASNAAVEGDDGSGAPGPPENGDASADSAGSDLPGPPEVDDPGSE